MKIETIGAGDLVKRAASAIGIEQTPDCGCAKRQQWMNEHLPRVPIIGSKPKPQAWTAPPEVPEGWEVVTACDHHALYKKGEKYIVWDLIAGQYRNSHTFCCGSMAAAARELDKRCR